MRTVLALALLCLLFPTASGAATILQRDLDYVLHNHPDGNQAPPPYGLRLDGLDGDETSVWTFDFDDPRSAMRMRWNSDDSLEIWGKALGGQDGGTAYVAGTTQVFQIHFRYGSVTEEGHALWARGPFPSGTGSITPETMAVGAFAAGMPIALEDFEGDNPTSFVVTANHRGFTGINGFGWLNHEAGGPDGEGGFKHVYASDWLFTATPVPEPSAALLFCTGAFVVSQAVRRRPR